MKRKCENACSTNAIKVKIYKIYYSGEYKELYWSELIKRSERSM